MDKTNKLGFKARTLDDDVVKDGLCAVSALEDNPSSRGLYFLVGGMATQSYLPISCRRATSDIDLAVLENLGSENFKDFSRTAAQYLQDNGYELKTVKAQNSWHLEYFKNPAEACVIGFARRSQNNMDRIKARLERELANSRKKVVEGRAATYPVSSPEDIAVPKLVRDIGFLTRNPELEEHIKSSDFVPLNDFEINASLEEIEGLREEAQIHLGDPTLAERLRFVSDIFDVRILSEMVGYNELYFRRAANDWDRLKEDSTQKKALFNFLLPHLF